MKTLYDVQQLLKRYDIYIYLGKRLWDIELMKIEVQNLYRAKLIDEKVFRNAILILNHEHGIELQKENNNTGLWEEATHE